MLTEKPETHSCSGHAGESSPELTDEAAAHKLSMSRRNFM